MARHGYTEGDSEDNWAMICWRGAVASAMRGKRGQTLLRELRDALDALPDKRLVRGEVVTADGECCAIGAVLQRRNVPYLGQLVGRDSDILCEWNEDIAVDLNVAGKVLQEIEYENDEGGWQETPEERWTRMRAWVERKIKPTPAPTEPRTAEEKT